MSKDQRLEEILMGMGQAEIDKPADLGSRTIERLHQSVPDRQREWQRARIIKRACAVAAAFLLMVTGALSTWGALTWWSHRGPAGVKVDYSSDPRVLSAQNKLPFSIALPTWLPEGYELGGLNFSPESPAEENVTVTLMFVGPEGSEPIIIYQGYQVEMVLPDSTSKMQFVQIGSPEDGYWLGSNNTGWGAGTRSDLGYYYETVIDETLMERALVFICHDDDMPTYVTVYSGSPFNQSRRPETIADPGAFLKIVQGIAGKSARLIPPGEEIAELTRNWALLEPTYLPQSFRKSGMYVSANIIQGIPKYSGHLSYVSSSYERFIYIQQRASKEPQAVPAGTEEVLLESQHAFVTGYFQADETGRQLFFSLKADAGYLDIAISTDSSLADRDELMAVAQSMISQYTCPDQVALAQFLDEFARALYENREIGSKHDLSSFIEGDNLELYLAEKIAIHQLIAEKVPLEKTRYRVETELQPHVRLDSGIWYVPLKVRVDFRYLGVDFDSAYGEVADLVVRSRDGGWKVLDLYTPRDYFDNDLFYQGDVPTQLLGSYMTIMR